MVFERPLWVHYTGPSVAGGGVKYAQGLMLRKKNIIVF